MNIRETIEQMERQNLCSAAVLVSESKGRAVPEEKCPLRTAFTIGLPKAICQMRRSTKTFLRLMKTMIFHGI